jgi:hypothetical protein
MKTLTAQSKTEMRSTISAELSVDPTLPHYMLRALLLLIVIHSALIAHAAAPPELMTAVAKLSEGRDRWAYTETKTNYHPDGTVKDVTIIQVDPSKPYPEQRIPIKIRGRAPTEKDLKKYRERGEKKAEARARAARLPTPKKDESSTTFASLPIDLGAVAVHAEDADTITYRVPLIQNDKQRLPPEKCEMLVSINKQDQTVRNIHGRLTDSVRMKLILKVKNGDFTFDFSRVHPDFPPVPTATRIQAHASMLFKNITQDVAITRTEYRRVTPYDERFEVKLGPLEILDL